MPQPVRASGERYAQADADSPEGAGHLRLLVVAVLGVSLTNCAAVWGCRAVSFRRGACEAPIGKENEYANKRWMKLQNSNSGQSQPEGVSST